MWIKKSKEELSKEKNDFKSSYTAPVTVFICSMLVMTIAKITGGAKSYFGAKPVNFIEFISLFPIILLIAIGLSVFTYLLQLRLRVNFFKEKDTTIICETCNNKKTDDGDSICSCGGEFKSITQMKWIENED